jgi:hypothetical protein
MKKAPSHCSHKPSYPSKSVDSISAPSRKYYSNGMIQLQKMPPRSRPPFYNNLFILSLKDKVVLQGGGNVRDLTSLTAHVGRIIYFPVIKANINKA